MKFRKRLKQALPRRGRKRVSGSVTRLTRSKEAFTAKANVPDATADEGVLRMEGDVTRLPTALAEAGDRSDPGLSPGPLVLVITALALAFIIIITWFITQMPAK